MYDAETVNTRAELRHLELREVYEGKIENTVNSLGDDLFAVVPEFDDPGEFHRIGPLLGWDKRSDNSFPAEDDLVLITEAQNGNFWVVNWYPA